MSVARELNMTACKNGVMKHGLFYLLLCLLLAGANGCASFSREPAAAGDKTQDQVTGIEPAKAAAEESGWWHVGFHRAIKADEEPLWHLDALLAYEVIRPILEKQPLTLWRFHRRAAPDASGHKFSFIFFSSRSTGEQIYRQIKEHPLVNRLQGENIIESLSFVDINSDARSNIEDTSDKKWSIELQKAWPAFIMGVSQTWLNLIEECIKQTDEANPEDVASQLARFELVNGKINSVWELEGGHAFLHHLNALFGYQEVYIVERRRTRF